MSETFCRCCRNGGAVKHTRPYLALGHRVDSTISEVCSQARAACEAVLNQNGTSREKAGAIRFAASPDLRPAARAAGPAALRRKQSAAERRGRTPNTLNQDADCLHDLRREIRSGVVTPPDTCTRRSGSRYSSGFRRTLRIKLTVAVPPPIPIASTAPGEITHKHLRQGAQHKR